MQLKRAGILLASWLVILCACARADQPATTLSNPATTTTTVASTTTSPSVDLSTADPCSYISNGDVIALFPEVDRGEPHLSGLNRNFRECVFFTGSHGIVGVELRRQPTAAADVEALLMEVFPSDPDFTQLTIQGLPAYYWSCLQGSEPCVTAIAFGSEPYFFVIHFESTIPSIGRPTTSADAKEAATALASAVLANLGK